ncbi:MAG: MFS transporter [Chloroflexota bacterium]|nr:MFS transporter [Chloroflexota bacterium]
MGRGWAWHLGLGRELGNVFWAMVGVEAAFGAYMSVWPLWIEALGAPVTVVGLVLGSAGLLRLLTLGPSAGLAERFDARRLIVVARVCAGLGMIAAALANHWPQLFLMVLGSAIGEIAFPLTQSHVAAHAGARRVRAFTLVFNVGPAAALGLSPLVSGALVAIWGMRAAFVFAAICTAVSILFFARIAPSPPRARDDKAADETSSYRAALADLPVRRLVTLQFATIFALAVGTSFVPTFLADERGLAPSTIAMLGGVGSVGSVLFGLVVARTLCLQRAPLLSVAIAVGFVALSHAVIATGHALWLIVVAFLGRGGLFSAWGLFVAGVSEVVAERHRGRAFALCEMMGGSAFSFAPILAGSLYATRPVLPLAVAVALGVLMIPVLLRAQRSLTATTDRRAEEPEPRPDPVLEPQVEPEMA